MSRDSTLSRFQDDVEKGTSNSRNISFPVVITPLVDTPTTDSAAMEETVRDRIREDAFIGVVEGEGEGKETAVVI
jgi:hypothetical protein